MKHELIIRPEAEVELAEAFDWYEEQVRGLGSEFLIAVDAAVHAIARNPLQLPKSTKVFVVHSCAGSRTVCFTFLMMNALLSLLFFM